MGRCAGLDCGSGSALIAEASSEKKGPKTLRIKLYARFYAVAISQKLEELNAFTQAPHHHLTAGHHLAHYRRDLRVLKKLAMARAALTDIAADTPIEVWFQDEARVGQRGTHAYTWAGLVR